MNGTHYVAYRFAVELLLSSAVYVLPFWHRRKAGFCWKLPLGIAICMVLSVFLGHWSQRLLLRQFVRYMVLFLGVTGLIYWCFALERYGALFCSVSAYATQHFMSKLFYFFQEVFPMPLGTEIAAYLAYMVLCYAVFYAVFAQRTREQDFTQLVQADVLILSVIVLSCNVILSCWSSVYNNVLPLAVKGIHVGYACLCCILILVIQFGIFRRSKLQNEMKMMAYLWDLERRQYQVSKDNMELLNIKCHDMKHLLSTLDSRISPEEKEKLSQMIERYDDMVKTGCEALDVVLAEKSILCRRDGITLTCIADGEKLNFMPQSDLYSLFGNVVDNAIEAVSQVEDTNKKIISLVVTAQKGAVVIHAENYYTGTLVVKNGLPVTSKSDKDYHGYGMKSIRLIAEKYGGTMTYSTESDIFRLDILLPIPTGN